MATVRNEVRKQKLMTGLFNDRESAESAYQALSSRGYNEKDINVVMSDDTRKKHFSAPGATETELGNKAAKGAGVAERSAARWWASRPRSLRSARTS